jgi:ABC-2 type transport system ATP-binding protein
MEINQLSFSYQSGKPILRDLGLVLPLGEHHGILGPNGAGKTTLFRILTGQLPLQSGTISLGGTPLKKQHVSFLEAEPYFYPYMTGQEYLRFILDDTTRIARWNGLFDLPLDAYADEYSTGMKKKLGLLGVLMQEDRPLLILDEPFNGVDFESAEIIMSVLQHPALTQRTILVSSHILSTLTRVCARISVLQEGTLGRTYERNEFHLLEDSLKMDMEAKVKGVLG